MCGIAGFISARHAAPSREEAVDAMCSAMVHRGPDDVGRESRGVATLGMRRLAIFDPAHGHQPMVTADGRFVIVFNGAIYNFLALRKELEAAGAVFRTQCDTEVLLAAFAHWGEACLPRLRGMFAFAVWDTRDHAFFCARDPFGIKPLYYHHDEAGGNFVFASELNALLRCPAVSAEIDPGAVSAYLSYFAVPAPQTIYRGVCCLRPGECATLKEGRLQVRAYWTFRNATETSVARCTSRTQFVGELRERLEDSLRAHVVADVPVGAFLSGGLDSTALVALMGRLTGSRLRTFSVGFAEDEYSEAGPAAAAAAFLGTEHHPFTLTADRVAGDLPGLLASLDQPTGDGINTYYASLAARAGGVTVALSGLGSDELLGGYPSFRDLPKIARWLPVWKTLPASWREALLRRWTSGPTRAQKLADFLRHAGNLHELSALQRRVLSETARRSLLTTPGGFTPHPELARLTAELPDAGAFETISAHEIRTYMADVLLRDSDVMSMRNSLELRVPFVDRPLVEWLWNQPAAFKYDARHPKSPLFDAVRDVLPPGMENRSKRGFTLPFARWMRAELRPFLEETFSTASVARSGLFDTTAVQVRWRGFIAGDDSREWSRLWSLALLIAFVNRPRPLAP